MKCQTDLAEGDNHACVSTDRSWYCSWVSGVKLWNMKSSILQTLPSFSRHSVAQDFRFYLSSSFPGSIVCTHLWSISSKANHITAQQVDYVVVQLPVPSKVFLFLVNVCALWGFPCNVAAHCVAEVLIRMKACVFSRILSESLSSARPSTVTISPNTGSKEEPLLTTPLYGELHLHTFPRICWRSSERRKVRVVVDRPRLCRGSSVDANVDGLKTSNTHQRIAKAIFFSYDAPSSRTLKLKKASPHYFRRPCHHLKVALPWFSSALRFSIVVSCNLQAEASVTGRERAAAAWSISKEVFFFFGIFGKSYARGRRETKKIITVALGVFSISVRLLTTENKTTPQICKITALVKVTPGQTK